MYEIVLFATPSSVVDEKTLQKAMEASIRFIDAPERCLLYGALDREALAELCSASVVLMRSSPGRAGPTRSD
jgi:hypothetical protein